MAACRDVLTPSSGGDRPAPAHLQQLFDALGARVADPWRDAKYDGARVRIANAAFIPSRVWNDSSVWTSSTSSRRTLLITGRFATNRYRLETAHALTPIGQVADSRHVINLTRLSDDEYAWDTDVAYAVGGITASEAARLVGGVFAAAEGRTEQQVRADYALMTPRTSAALGQLLQVDSVRTVTRADRSTLATTFLTMRPEGIEKRYPNFARYLRKYVGSTVLHSRVSDRSGADFLRVDFAAGRLQMRVRTLNGALAPLASALPARTMPDSLVVTTDFTTKVRRFTIGLRGYRSDLTVVRTPHESAWNFVSREEPEWVLPPVTERLLRTPLRRPFQGSGAVFRVGIRDDSMGGQSVLHRRMHLEVQESLILRFIGRLGAIAVSDYSGDAEREQYQFLAEVFGALAADTRALASR